MLRIGILAVAAEGYLLAPVRIDQEARTLAVGESTTLTADEVGNIDADCFILSGCRAEDLAIPEMSGATLEELKYLAGKKHPRTGQNDLLEQGKMEGWELDIPTSLERSLDDALRAVLGFIGRVQTLSERLRRSLAMIADEGGFPTALITLEPSKVLLGENPYFPEDLRSDLPPRAKVREDTALDALRDLPKTEEVFAKLRAGEFAKQGYEYRAEQEQFAQAVDEALARETHLLIEAGTGVGKSLGYLIPSVRHALSSGEPILISTNTKILQDQLLTSDFPKLMELLGHDLPPPVVLKGRENYLCLEKLRLHALTTRMDLRELIQEIAGAGQQRAAAIGVMCLVLHMASAAAGDFEYIVLPKGLPVNASRRLKHRLNAAFRGCLRERCPLLRQCYFYAQRDAAERSPLTIVNHALLFALAHPEVDPAGDPLASFVDRTPVWVLDEAHNLEEVLLAALGVCVRSFDLIEFVNGTSRLMQNRALLSRLSFPQQEIPSESREDYLKLKDLQAQVPGAAEAVYGSFGELGELIELAYNELREGNAGDVLRLDLTEPHLEEVRAFREKLLDRVAMLYDHLLELNEGLILLAERTGGDQEGFFYIDDNRYQMHLREVVNNFEGLKSGCTGILADAETWVRWVEAFPTGRRGELSWELAACPVVVGTYFTDLLEQRKCALMVSGSLAIHRNFSYVKRCLGLNALEAERLQESILASPFDYQRRALVLVPGDIPEPDFKNREAHTRYLQALAEIAQEAAQVFGGSTLVLFNSYSDLQAVLKMSEPLIDRGFTLLAQERGASRLQLAGEFKRLDKAVLFGTRSFWEGFDIPGEDLQCVVISRFPFPNLHDPLTGGKARYIDRNGGNSFADFMLPSAIMKFTQGFGRLIRSTEDYGCVLLLDRRALTKNYGMEFLHNLPGPVVKNLPRGRLGGEMSRFLSRMRGVS